VLGEGGQSTVWLAFDPRLERDVALKLLSPANGSDALAVTRWLEEARSVGRLSHPHIVPVYEADIHEDRPYLVFQYVAGPALHRYLQQQGPVPAAQAVAWMGDVLSAVAAAHAAGVIHRDLKPSNILINADGQALIMDFGIAARMQAGGPPTQASDTAGTIGYLSPEAATGAAPSPAMDIFSAGLVLAEMLSGQRLLAETDWYRAVYRVTHEQLRLPDHLPAGVDDRLRGIVHRALAKDPFERFVSAEQFRQELLSWSTSLHTPALAESGADATLEFLLRRMRHKSDFPALSDAVSRIQSMALSDKESVSSVTNEILKDVALTNKLLRLVNSAHYARSGSISTVSRAVHLVGFNNIRNMALSLVLLEHMQDKAHAALLKEEFLRSLMAASIGTELSPIAQGSEEAFLGSMFLNLGRLLAQFYFPEEMATIRTLMQDTREPKTEAGAAISVLGISLEDLGLGIARTWNLPATIQRCMRKPAGAPPAVLSLDSTERIRWIAVASNEIADVLLHAENHEVAGRVAAVVKKYAGALGGSVAQVQEATVQARGKLVDLVHAMDIQVLPGSVAARLLRLPAGAGADAVATPAGMEDGLSDLALQASPTVRITGPLTPEPTHSREAVVSTLSAGIQDITDAMVEDSRLSDILRMVLETMYRALALDRVIFCMRDAKTETMSARFGLGHEVEAYIQGFKTQLKAPSPDLFGVVCNRGVDTMISDATEPRIAQRLPVWYRQGLNAPAFLLLPLHIKGAPLGLIYADKLQAGGLELDDKELALLRTLRNQAVMAFKQSG
jgi:serine/threonine protein kinase